MKKLRPISIFICVHLCSSAVIFSGCQQNFGTGGTGELVVPHATLHDVKPFDIASSATTQASTEPTTRPMQTPGATTRPLTIEQVRTLALRNNLDLKVELLNPTISR